MDALENFLADFFSKLPAFPSNVKEMLRKYYPWVLIVVSVFSGLAALAALGLGTLTTLIVPVSGTMVVVTGALLALRAALGLFGGIRMLSGARQGWTFAFYSALVAVVANIIDFNIAGLFGNFIFLWILFQIREFFVSDSSGQSSF